jgi:hypothetical protein
VSSFDRLLGLLREGTGCVGLTTANTREIGWRAAWTGHRLEAAIIPSDGKTTVTLVQSVRRAAAGIAASSVVVGLNLGFLVAGLADKFARQYATSPWLHTIGTELHLGRSIILRVALAIGSVVALSSIPIGRLLIRRMRDTNSSRLRLLAGALTANARLAVKDRT